MIDSFYCKRKVRVTKTREKDSAVDYMLSDELKIPRSLCSISSSLILTPSVSDVQSRAKTTDKKKIISILHT